MTRYQAVIVERRLSSSLPNLARVIGCALGWILSQDAAQPAERTDNEAFKIKPARGH